MPVDAVHSWWILWMCLYSQGWWRSLCVKTEPNENFPLYGIHYHYDHCKNQNTRIMKINRESRNLLVWVHNELCQSLIYLRCLCLCLWNEGRSLTRGVSQQGYYCSLIKSIVDRICLNKTHTPIRPRSNTPVKIVLLVLLVPRIRRAKRDHTLLSRIHFVNTTSTP